MDLKTQTLEQKINRLNSRVEQLSSLIEVSIIINSTLDLDKLIELVLDKAEAVMNAEASSMFLINEKTNLMECEVARGKVGAQVQEIIRLAKGQGVAGWVWDRGEALIVPDVSADDRFFSGVDQQSGFITRSILAAPLIVRDRIIGVAEVLNPKDGGQFTEEDLDLFLTFCRQVALAVENARLHRLEIEQERIRQQLESARVIQQSFMPQELPVCPAGRYEIAAKSLPAIAVGGDLYDAIVLDDDHIGILIGDVSGKGIPAALYMARLVSDFRFHVKQTVDPGELLAVLNNALVERSRQGMFVTLQYILVDVAAGKIAVANGGHLPVIYIQKETGNVFLLDSSSGCPLGILSDSEFPVAEYDLNFGDALLLYTDGVTEAKNKRGEQFSIERLKKSVKSGQGQSEKIIKSVVDNVHRFSRGTEQHDDITVLAMSWQPRRYAEDISNGQDS